MAQNVDGPISVDEWLRLDHEETASEKNGRSGDSVGADPVVRQRRDAVKPVLERARLATREDEEHREYGGLIYRKTNGTFGTTDLVRGMAAEKCRYGTGCVDVFEALPQVPNDARVVGSFHSHPNNRVGKIYGRFSEDDIVLAQGRNVMKLPLDSYVITPDGGIDEYDRFLNKITTIQH